MAYTEYWNPKTETMPRDQLERLQLIKLQRMCEWAYAKVPFHKRAWERAGFHPNGCDRKSVYHRLFPTWHMSRL